jgi:L-alanine-DL-glutamate epimerase-like enolase superfamily enzyme
LLGGSVRERLRMYRWCGGDDNTPDEVIPTLALATSAHDQANRSRLRLQAAAEAKAVIAGSNFKQLKMNACARLGYLRPTKPLLTPTAREREREREREPERGRGRGRGRGREQQG